MSHPMYAALAALMMSSGPSAPSYTNVGAFDDITTASSSRSFSGVVLPTGGLVVVFAATRGGSDRTITGITMDGAAMDEVESTSTGSFNPTGIYTKSLGAGDTVDFVMSVSGGTVAAGSIYVVILHDLTSTTAIDHDETEATTGTSGSRPLDLVDGALAFWIVNERTPENVTWSNATELYDNSPNVTMQWSVAVHTGTTTETRTATATWTTSDDWSMCAAAWR